MTAIKLLAVARRPQHPPLTERQIDIVEAIKAYLADVELHIGQHAKWICAAKLQEKFGDRLVCAAFGWRVAGKIKAHTFADWKRRELHIIDGRRACDGK
jgi:hypothetical protein